MSTSQTEPGIKGRKPGRRGLSRLLFLNLALVAVLAAAYIYVSNMDDGVPRRGDLAPAFDLPLVTGGGGQLGLSTYRGKAVVLNFWASWCGVCRGERPLLSRLREDTGAAFLGVATMDSLDEVQAVESATPHGYPIVFDADGLVADHYGVTALPHTVVVGADGTVLRRYGRALRASDVEELTALLAAAAAHGPLTAKDAE